MNDDSTLQMRPVLMGVSIVVIFAAIITTGCDVPTTADPSAVAEGAPPDPTYVTPDSEDGKQLAAAKEKLKEQQAEKPPTKQVSGVGDPKPQGDGAAGKKTVVKAKAGVGKKGHYGSGGFITTPISAYFRAKERVKFLQIQDGLKKFNALYGRWPKDYKEVMDKVIGPRGILMPVLRKGDRYNYDPKKGQEGLVVERSK